MMRDDTKRICLWSGPRNISTALMYSFAQRKDTRVYDEPLYGFYLSHTAARDYHPGAETIIESMESDGSKVIDMMMSDHNVPVVFFKNMTHHLLDLDRGFMSEVVNVILTRDPVEMLPSFDKVIDNPSMADVGYALHTELVDYLMERDTRPIIVNAKSILMNPADALSSLCQKIGIPFDEAMLSWEKGARPEDGVWAKYWYESIHDSTGFKKYKPKDEPFPERLKPLLDDCMPHYQRLIGLMKDDL